MNKYTLIVFLFSRSFLNGQDMIQIKLKNGSTVDGEFVGTYMEHIHLLIGENINYFKCDDIQSATKQGSFNVFEYDCSKNTVTADILFPPKLNPMTGEWETNLPEVFSQVKQKKQKEKPQQPKPTNFNKKKKPEKKTNTMQNQSFNSSSDKIELTSMSEEEIIRFIRKEVKKEVKKQIPEELKKHKKNHTLKTEKTTLNKIIHYNPSSRTLGENLTIGCVVYVLLLMLMSW